MALPRTQNGHLGGLGVLRGRFPTYRYATPDRPIGGRAVR